jgi:hypothetical protein
MKQTEQQHVRLAVSDEIVHDRIDPLDCGVDPGFNLT